VASSLAARIAMMWKKDEYALNSYFVKPVGMAEFMILVTGFNG
jgi:hypothetical protein